MSTYKDCFTFNWQIENFRVLTNTPIDLDSPVFHAHKIKWFLRLHASGEMVHSSICRSPEANTKSITIGISTELVSIQTIIFKYVNPHETSANDILIQSIPVEKLKNELRSKDLQVRCTIFAHEMREMNIPLLHCCAAREEYTVESIGKPLVVARPLVSHAVTRIHVVKSTVMFDVPPISEVNQEKSFYLESSLEDWVSLRISVLRIPKVDQMLVRIRRVVIDYSKWSNIQIFSHLVDRLEGQFYRNSFQHCFVQHDPDYTWEFSVDIFSSNTTSKKRRSINKAVASNPGCLRIYLEMLISQEGCYQNSRQDTKCTIDTSTLSLQRDLESMSKLKKSQDTYLVASDGQAIPVHGYILRARSSVFDRMLTSDMQEKIHRKINLQLDETAVKAFVTFFYTGHFQPKTTKVACSLLSVGHMYELTSLIEKCTDFLMHNTTVDSVIDILKTANFLDDSMLFGTTRKFMVLRAVEVFHTNKWLFIDWNPWDKLEFSLEVLREAMQYQNLDALIDLLKRKQRIALLEN